MPLYPTDIPIVIIGAGPTGLTAANLLAVYGIDCVVLEQNEGPMNLPRAIVLDDEGARTMQVFGLDKTYLKDTMEGTGSRYYDDAGNCFAETGQGPRTFGFAKRQFFFQPELEEALRDVLAQKVPGTLHFGAQVTDVSNSADDALVTVRDAEGQSHQIRTQWVLACDGGRSPVREHLGIAMSGNTYEEDWIVVDTVNDPDTTLYSKFFCSGFRPTVSVPAPHGGRRYEFMLLAGETRKQVLEDAFLEGLVAPYRPYRTKDILRKTVYRFHARMAEQFQSGRTLLMGDAAHLTPPFAGQGMNAGLRDAHNVAWKLAAILLGGANADIMQSYEIERRKPAWDMIQLAVAMGSIVMPAGRDQIMFRDLMMQALDPFPAVKDWLVHMRFKPKPSYSEGLFLDLDTPVFEASLVGEMIPQPDVTDFYVTELLDDKMGPGFCLIAQNAAGSAALASLERTKLLGLPLTKITLDTMDRNLPSALRPVQHQTARPLLTHRDQIMMIRPDRYCAAAFFPNDLERALDRYTGMMASLPTKDLGAVVTT
jgi:3-(3-hydroxy-phenyl)propionate hydroxylase